MNFCKHTVKRHIFYLLLSISLLLPHITGCSSKASTVSQSGFYFDTVVTITIYDTVNPEIFTEIFSLCDTYEKMLSRTMEGSDIWNINHAEGQPTAVSPETISLIKTAVFYAKLSDGRIDPTIARVVDLWDFSGESAVLPDDTLLADACSRVNYEAILIDETTHTVTLTDPDAQIDLGFIAKGYIADRIKEYMLSKDVAHATINLGGNVLCVGTKPDGSPFQIGIQYPFGGSGDILTAIPCTDSSVVTSGIYERYFVLQDTLYHHILDTRTGYPVQNNLLSVTILSASSVQGDALSTLCFIYGLDDGMELIESLEDVEAIFVTDDYKIHYSSGL